MTNNDHKSEFKEDTDSLWALHEGDEILRQIEGADPKKADSWTSFMSYGSNACGVMFIIISVFTFFGIQVTEHRFSSFEMGSFGFYGVVLLSISAILNKIRFL